MTPLPVFIGFDHRQPLAYTVARASVERHAKRPVAVQPLRIDWLPIKRVGLTEFTFSRYLVPWLCQFKGPAVFMDADIVVRADVHDLVAAVDPAMAVSVAKHVARFEWPSVMVFRCDNTRCWALIPEYIDAPENQPQTLEWAGNRLGDLPREWNFCVGYEEPYDTPKLIHFTAGIPCWPETIKSPHADLWIEEWRAAKATCSWEELMGQSVHRGVVEAMARG